MALWRTILVIKSKQVLDSLRTPPKPFLLPTDAYIDTHLNPLLHGLNSHDGISQAFEGICILRLPLKVTFVYIFKENGLLSGVPCAFGP